MKRSIWFVLDEIEPIGWFLFSLHYETPPASLAKFAIVGEICLGFSPSRFAPSLAPTFPFPKDHRGVSNSPVFPLPPFQGSGRGSVNIIRETLKNESYAHLSLKIDF